MTSPWRGRRPGRGGRRRLELDDDRLGDRVEGAELLDQPLVGDGVEVDERQRLGPIGVPAQAPLGDVDAVIAEDLPRQFEPLMTLYLTDRTDDTGDVLVEHQEDRAGGIGLEPVVGHLDDARMVVGEDDARDGPAPVAPVHPAGELVAVVCLAR